MRMTRTHRYDGGWGRKVRELRKNFERLVGRWIIVVVAVMVGAGMGVLYANLVAPTYTASTVVVATADQSMGSERDVSFAQAYGRLVGQRDIAVLAEEAAGRPADAIRSAVQATTSPSSPIIEITGTGPTPRAAADTVNAVADQIVAVAGSRQVDTGVRLLVLSGATPPTTPSSPVLTVDVAVGAAAGFLLGGLAALARAGRRRDEETGPSRPAIGVTSGGYGGPGDGPAGAPQGQRPPHGRLAPGTVSISAPTAIGEPGPQLRPSPTRRKAHGAASPSSGRNGSGPELSSSVPE
jgi:capsular polysaccharide biosynthesis protein